MIGGETCEVTRIDASETYVNKDVGGLAEAMVRMSDDNEHDDGKDLRERGGR